MLYAIVDCNNFFASCERVFDPKLENKPVIVLSSNDGNVIARSNEAKALGIGMADPYHKILPIVRAKGVKVFSSNFTLYGDLSDRVMTTLSEFSPEVEVYSIDECFLNLKGFEHRGLVSYGKEIRSNIKRWVGIPVSVGIAQTKTLAKLANFIAKRNPEYEGVNALSTKEETEHFLKKIDVGEVWGIGRQYRKLLNLNGINTAYDLSMADERWIKKSMNVLALKTALELRGISCIELEEERPAKKSITVSRSFSQTTGDINHLRQAVVTFITRGAEKLRKEKKEAKYVGVFIRTNPYSQVDAQYSGYTFTCLPYPTDNTMELIRGGVGCLEKIYREGFLYKKAGILLGDFFDKSLARFDMFDERDLIKSTVLMQTLDKINNIYGSKTIYFGGGGRQQKWLPKASMKSKSYTTRWEDITLVT